MKSDQSELSLGAPVGHSTRQSQKEATRRSIVRAARACFLTDGVTKTNFDDIAARAGVSRATVYLHFSSKEQLLLSLLEEDWAVQIRLFEGLSGTASSAEDFARWLRQVSEGYRARSQSMGLYALALAQNPEMSDLIDQQRERLVAALGQKFAAFA
ncbi:MAG TPA: TetR family transcriptional regulator, partial [Novosphingobium sp.]